MPENDQQAEQYREGTDEDHPATVIELNVLDEGDAERATEPGGAERADAPGPGLPLTKRTDAGAPMPDGPSGVAGDSASAGGVVGAVAAPPEWRDVWAPPNPADRSAGPAPYGAQPPVSGFGTHGAPPAAYGAGRQFGAVPAPTSPGFGGPVPPPPIGPEGPGPAPAGPPSAGPLPGPGPAPYGGLHAGPMSAPYVYGAGHQPSAPYGPAYGAAHAHPAPYPHQAWGWPPRPRNGMGDAALALGIIGLVLFVAFPLAMVLGVLALIFGAIGRGRARRGEASNRGQALAGMICGGVALVLATLVLVLVVATADEETGGGRDEGGYSATSVR